MSTDTPDSPAASFGGRVKTVVVSGVEVVIRELSVGEVAQWMEGKINPDASELTDAGMIAASGFYVGDDLTLADLMAMTDLNTKTASHFFESDLLELATSCRELNRSFLSLAARTNLARSAIETLTQKGQG